jgi:hypothetical protein
LVIDTTLIERFIKIQAEVDQYDNMGIFDALMIAEEEVENLRKQKATTEISYKVLCEKTKKEKLDFDAVTKAANIGSFFKDAHTQNKLISKEEVGFQTDVHQFTCHFIQMPNGLLIFQARIHQRHSRGRNILE